MKIILGLLFIYLIFPYIGLYNYDGFGGSVSTELKILYFIHIFIEGSVLLLVYFFINTLLVSNNFIQKYNIRKIFNYSLFILIGAILINLFIFGNYKILLGEIGRGKFRTTLHFGFLYVFLSFYLPAGLIALNTFLYTFSEKRLRKKMKFKYLLVILFSMLLGFLTGFKSTAVFISLVGLAAADKIIKIKHLILFGLVLVILMAISGYLFMNFDNFGQVFFYLFKRATSIAVDGTVGVYNLFPNGGHEAYMILLYVFGNKMASLFSGYDIHSLNFISHIDLGRYIGYLTYPTEISLEALRGAFNLTITNFGEAVYLFGKNYFYIYTLLVSFIISILIYLYKKANITLKVILLVYFFTNVIPGGGRLINIFSITVFIYLLMVYLVIKFIFIKSKKKVNI